MSYELDVLVNGKSVVKYPWRDHVFLEGREGTEYTIRFRNNSVHRVLAILSVDGLSVMDGEQAELDGTGYVVEPWSTLDVPGWRLNNEDVATFKFGKRGKAYADKKGEGSNVGVIGCAVFKEKYAQPYFYCEPFSGPVRTVEPVKVTFTTQPTWTGHSTGPCTWVSCDTSISDSTVTCSSVDAGPVSSFGSTTAGCYHVNTVRNASEVTMDAMEVDPAPQYLGTEFGKRRRDVVQEVVFKRESSPEVILELHYDSRKGLEQRGIRVGKKPRQVARAFKNAKGVGCKPPSGWRGHPHY